MRSVSIGIFIVKGKIRLTGNSRRAKQKLSAQSLVSFMSPIWIFQLLYLCQSSRREHKNKLILTVFSVPY